MKLSCAITFILITGALAKECPNKKTSSKLFCYYSKVEDVNSCHCTHIVLPANIDDKTVDGLKEKIAGVKILITAHEFNEALVNILKNTKVDGLEINLKKLSSRNDISDFISTVRSKLSSDFYIAVAVPPKAEILAKYYDFKALSKNADSFILQTSFLGASKNVTFHPSRLSGLWDMQNTDSVVDLVSGLGAPLSKVVITAPVQAFQFKLQSEEHTAPGSPALEVFSITRSELCKRMGSGSNWTLERDQDQAGPYIFRKNQWIAFDDATSMDIKAKYSRVRGLAGLALKDLSQDGGEKCGGSLLEAAFNGLSKQARAPRGAVLHSLEREILETPARPLDTIQVSPYRISRIIDVEGNVHVIRQDTRTEFECARQGYYVHPRSCGRFYRCVKFDQLANDFNVFEFDCPAGLVFDSSVEVCVWPGSLPYSSSCSGSSEIAPVPRERFICPGEPGYYADPENCRWFFACLDHGKAPLSAYEFRCPFGLVFDQDRLLCEWPWLVPRCGSGGAFGVDFGFEQHETVDYYGGGVLSNIQRLDTYDGLGTLGTVALGGLSGTLIQPINKVYSSSSIGIGSGSNFGHGQGAFIATGGVGFSKGQLEANAEGHGNSGFGIGQGAYISTGGAGYSSAGQFEASSLSGASLVSGNAGYSQNVDLSSGQHFGSVDSSQYFDTKSEHTGSFGIGEQTYELHGDAYETSSPASVGQINIVGGGYSAVGGAKSGIKITHHGATAHVTPVPLTPLSSTISVPVVASVPVPQTKTSSHFGSYYGGVVANFPELQYKLDGPNGFLGYSNNNSTGINGFVSSVFSTGEGGYAYPKPAAGFVEERIKIVKPDVSFVEHKAAQPVVATYQNQQHVVAVTPQPTLNILQQTVSLAQPAIGISKTVHHQPAVAVQPSISVPIETYTTRPAVSFIRHRVEAVQPDVVATYHQKPATLLAYNQPSYATAVHNQAQTVGLSYQQPSYSFYNQTFYNNAISGGYKYPQPAISFEEGPAVGYNFVGSSTIRPLIQQNPSILTYSTAKPPVIVASTYRPTVEFVDRNLQPAVSVVEHRVQNQPVVAGYQRGSQNEGYVYSKPTVRFEEKQRPVVSYNYQQQSVNSGGYHYEKPSVVFEEQPVVLSTPKSAIFVQSTTKPITFIQQKPVGYNYQQQSVSSGGYHYKKPSVVFEETPVVFSTPKTAIFLQSTPKPITFVQKKPLVSSYSFAKSPIVVAEQIAVQGYGVSSTPRPHVLVDQRPIAPAVVSSYSISSLPIQKVVGVSPTPNPAVLVEQKPVVSSYSYASTSQPAVLVDQKPIVQPVQYFEQKPAVVSSYSYSNVPVQKSVVYAEQQKQAVFPTPTSSVLVEQQPFEVYHGKAAITSSYSYSQLPQIQPAVVAEHKVVQPIVSSYSVSSTPRPAVVVEQKPVEYYQHKVVQPIVSTYSVSSTPQPAVVVNQKPIVQPVEYYQHKPAVVSSYSFSSKPVVAEQKIVQPIISSTLKPTVLVEQKPVQYYQPKPAVVSSYSFSSATKDYVQPVVSTTPKSRVVFEQNQVIQPVEYYEHKPAVVSSYSYSAPRVEQKVLQPAVSGFSTSSAYNSAVLVEQKSKPIRFYEQKPAIIESYSYQKPSVQPVVSSFSISSQPNYINQASVSSYSSQDQGVVYGGYDYPKPAVAFEETPIVSSTVKPVVVQRPALVSTYNYQKQAGGYAYPKPSVVFEERPIVSTVKPVVVQKQAVVSSYSYQKPVGYNYPKPAVTFEETPLVSTVKSVVVDQPAVVSSYNYQKPIDLAKTVVQEGYEYPKPAVQFEPQEYVVEQKIKPLKPVVVESYQYQPPTLAVQKQQANDEFSGYAYPKPSVQFVESYENRQPVYEEPIVAKKAYVTGYDYRRPSVRLEPIREEVYVTSTLKTVLYETPAPNQVVYKIKATPKPTFASTVATVIAAKLRPFTEKLNFYSYDSRLTSTPRPVVKAYSTTPVVVSTTNLPIAQYSFDTVDQEIPLQKIQSPQSTTSRPIYKYEFGSLVDSTTPQPVLTSTYQPIIQTQNYVESYVAPQLQVSTSTTLSPEPLLDIEVTSPRRTYLPSTTKSYEPVAPRRRPVKVVKLVRPKTIVKVNDFHPLLSAKLGAQCTCVSNTVKLRKKPAQYEDSDYVQPKPIAQAAYLDDSSEGVVIENYEYEPRKVDITPVPEVYIKSTTNPALPAPAPAYAIRKSSRVRPLSTSTYTYEEVTPVVDVFLKSSTPRVKSTSDQASDKEIVDVVRKGLKLIKAAAKEGAKEALDNHSFDRYGPGGWRSRDEKLQGTVDCQRAGLFRHPTQCNKFYACRWDCTKNRFTLHVFNCPVHLTFDSNLGACNWPSQGPACLENTLLPDD